MAKTKLKSVLLTLEEERELNEFIKNRIVSVGANVTTSEVIREALFKYIRNGQPEAEQDDKQEPAELSPESPTEENDNPFADLNFDT